MTLGRHVTPEATLDDQTVSPDISNFVPHNEEQYDYPDEDDFNVNP